MPKETLMMLCEKWDGEDLTGNWIAEPKFDGVRCVILVDEHSNCTAISRGNKQFWNWEHIAQEIKSQGLRDVALDGEFFAGNFGLTMKIVKSQKWVAQRLELKYFVFDMLSLREWETRSCIRPLAVRKLAMLHRSGYKYVTFIEGVRVSGIDEFNEAADTFYKGGYEGAVLKALSSEYTFGRSDQWLKIKPEEDCDLTVVDAFEGEGKHAGRLGGFVCEGMATYKKKRYSVRVRVGGGLTDEQRERFWAMHKKRKLVGTVIEVKFQDVTTEMSESTEASLRFPRFNRVREDKAA